MTQERRRPKPNPIVIGNSSRYPGATAVHRILPAAIGICAKAGLGRAGPVRAGRWDARPQITAGGCGIVRGELCTATAAGRSVRRDTDHIHTASYTASLAIRPYDDDRLLSVTVAHLLISLRCSASSGMHLRLRVYAVDPSIIIVISRPTGPLVTPLVFIFCF